MSQSFVEQMTALRDRISPLAGGFGNPNIRSLVVRTRLGNDYEYLEITPSPVIQDQFPSKEGIENLSSVEGITKSYSVKGISRRYLEEQLKGEGVDYIVGADTTFYPPDGVVCNLVSLTKNIVTWDMELVEKISSQGFYL
nr:MAG: hypothetical protein [uncultured cyanophage]